MKYKIEFDPRYMSLRYVVYCAKPRWLGSTSWERIDAFDTEADARARIDALVTIGVKFPVYLP
jgi:hypothetical protein